MMNSKRAHEIVDTDAPHEFSEATWAEAEDLVAGEERHHKVSVTSALAAIMSTIPTSAMVKLPALTTPVAQGGPVRGLKPGSDPLTPGERKRRQRSDLLRLNPKAVTR